MKLKKDYILRQRAGKNIVVKTEAGVPEEKIVFALNDSGALLWKVLENGAGREQMLAVVRENYEVEEKQAIADVAEFVERLRLLKALED